MDSRQCNERHFGVIGGRTFQLQQGLFVAPVQTKNRDEFAGLHSRSENVEGEGTADEYEHEHQGNIGDGRVPR